MEYLSKQKYDEIAAELNHLISEVYPKVTEDLAEADTSRGFLCELDYLNHRRPELYHPDLRK